MIDPYTIAALIMGVLVIIALAVEVFTEDREKPEVKVLWFRNNKY